MIESMDACFGLVRKKSPGSNIIPSRHSGTFFAASDEVDSFVDNYCKSAKEAPTVRRNIQYTYCIFKRYLFWFTKCYKVPEIIYQLV